MEKIYNLVEQIRQSNYENQQLFYELKDELMSISKCARENGKHVPYLIQGENFTTDDAFLTGNRYEEVFLKDVVHFVVDVDFNLVPTETYLKVFEYMIQNNIRSYKQDW